MKFTFLKGEKKIGEIFRNGHFGKARIGIEYKVS